MSKIEIYYADDDEDDLMVFEDAVKVLCDKYDENIILHLHKNGIDLIDTIKKNKIKPCVVFLDLNMPLKSGFQILEEIRSDPEINHIPVIIYSTSADHQTILKSQTLGASSYAVKPSIFKELKQLIRSALKIDWNNRTENLNEFVLNNL